jgi:hypothetical protein
MSAVGNFYSRCTSSKVRTKLSSSALPTIELLNREAATGNQVAGGEILAELSRLHKRVHKRLIDLEMAGALEEILQVLSTAHV